MPVNMHKPSQAEGSGTETIESLTSYCQDIDVTKRDRFELLSAYLDGEVTPEERCMVLNWMNNDPKAKRLYDRLLYLRRGFREGHSSPCTDADAAVAQIFRCLNYRMQLMGMAGLGAFVFGVLGLLSGSMGHHTSVWRWASTAQPEYLEIALDQPAFPIPKAPNATITLDSSPVRSQGLLPVESEL